MISKDNTRTLITLSKELKEKLEQLAKQDSRSLNNYILMIIKSHVENLDK